MIIRPTLDKRLRAIDPSDQAPALHASVPTFAIHQSPPTHLPIHSHGHWRVFLVTQFELIRICDLLPIVRDLA
jgi:hypothetical protein